MENTTPFADPATPASEAAFTDSSPITSGDGQSPVPADSTSQTAIQHTPPDNPPTHVTATPIVPAPAPEAVPLPQTMGLSQRQRIALQALAAGAGPGSAAKAAGVNPGTLFRWRKYDPRFIAALNAWQAESIKTARLTLLAANEQAAITVLRAVQNGDVRAALAVLKASGTLSPAKVVDGLTPTVKRELDNQRDKLVADMGSESRQWKENTRRAEEEAARQAQAKAQQDAEEAEKIAREKKERRERYHRLRESHLRVPPMPRPVQPMSILGWWKKHRDQNDIQPYCVSVTIVAVTGNPARLMDHLTLQWNQNADEARANLADLPWLLNKRPNPAEAEFDAKALEFHGAVIELRPAWK